MCRGIVEERGGENSILWGLWGVRGRVRGVGLGFRFFRLFCIDFLVFFRIKCRRILGIFLNR